MITTGNLLLSIIISLVVLGILRYFTGKAFAARSRSAVLAIFAYGMLASAAAIIAISSIHIYSIAPFKFHVDPYAIFFTFQEDVRRCFHYSIDVLVTFGVYALSFSLNQLVIRQMLRKYQRRMNVSLSEELSRRYVRDSAKLYVIDDESLDAFSMSVLEFRDRAIPRVQNVIVLTSGAVNILEPDELEAVIAHEASHVRNGDTRYLPFFNTLSTLIFLDPLVRHLSERLFRGSEFTADLDAAIATKPLALAKALLKAYTHGRASFPVGFLGHKKYSLLMERINRLLALENFLAQCVDGHVHKRSLAPTCF